MDGYLGEIRSVAFSYAPLDWSTCAGQNYSVTQYSALFSLLGATFGGNGQTTFWLPDLRGRTPRGVGTGVAGTQNLSPVAWGQVAGAESYSMRISDMPSHTHAAAFSPSGNVSASGNASLSVTASNVSLNVSGTAKLNAVNTGASSTSAPVANSVMATVTGGGQKIYGAAGTGNAQLGPNIDLSGTTATGTVTGTASGPISLPVSGVNGTVAIANTGGGTNVPLMNPNLGLYFIICVQGLYPARQ